jgi:hypothetical protein
MEGDVMVIRGSDLRRLALKYDEYLQNSGLTDLEPWQQEVREYVRDWKAPSILVEQQLRAWGEQQGLIGRA